MLLAARLVGFMDCPERGLRNPRTGVIDAANSAVASCTAGVLGSRAVIHRAALLGMLALALAGCSVAEQGDSAAPRADIELREGQPVATHRPTPLHSPEFVIRGMAADGHNLYVSGLRFAEGEAEAEGKRSSATGVIVKVPLLGLPETLAEGAFIPMSTLRIVGDRLYWHERHDSPDGPGLRSLALDGGDLERVSSLSGHSWVIHPGVIYFTRPDDEIDEGGFYRLEHRPGSTAKPKLVARRRGVVRTLLASPGEQSSDLYWTTRARKDGTWGVFRWDGDNSGVEILRSDETFASLTIDGEDFLWVTWAEDEGQPLHSLYRRPIAGGDTRILARKRGHPGFMEVFADPEHIYLTTVRGGELRRLAKAGGEVELLAGTGDRNVVSNRFNLFWVDERAVYWMRK
jgi:hypothetical protein